MSLFNKVKASYTHKIKDGVVLIVDLNIGTSVTNDMENVLAEIEEKEGKHLKGCKIAYQDTEGIWDGVTYNKDGSIDFYSIDVMSENEAFDILKTR